MTDNSVNEFDEAYEDDRAVFGDPYPALLDRLGAREPGQLLDLGCGQGRNAVPLAALGHEVTAVDTSGVGVEQTVRRAAENGDVVIGVVADLDEYVIDSAYDVVLIDMVLHALEDAPRRRLLEQVRAALEPGGLAIFVLPEPGPLMNEVVDTWAPWSATVIEMGHRLTSGAHAGDYTFTAVLGSRPTGER